MPISFYDKQNQLQTVDDDYDETGVNQAQVGLKEKGYVTGQRLLGNKSSKQPGVEIFVPDTELGEALKSGKFDTQDQVSASKQKIDVGPGETFLRGTASAATLGFSDEASAGLGAIKDKVLGKKEFLKSYMQRRDQYRDVDKSAAEQNPVASFAGNVAGGIAGGLGSVGKGIANAVKSSASLGAAAGLGESESDTALGDIGNAAMGAGIGAALPVGFEAIKKGVQYAAPKVAVSALRATTRLPTDTIKQYSERNAYIKQARPLAEIAVDAEKATGDLAKRVSSGSGTSFKILNEQSVELPKQDVVDAMRNAIKKIDDKGVFSPTVESEKAGFEKIIDAVKASDSGAEKMTGAKVKSLIQQIDESVGSYKKNAGDISTASQREFSNSRKGIDELLKTASPAYREQMLGVASDAKLLQNVKPILGTKEKALNTLKRLGREQSPFQKETVQDLDAALGKGLAREAKDSAIKDAFTKEVTNGSRNVNYFSNVPLVGPMLGYFADMSIRPTAAKAIDYSVKSKAFLEQNKERLGKFFRPFETALKSGPAAVLATHQILMKDPEYRKRVANE
jgi:hypothetical protein